MRHRRWRVVYILAACLAWISTRADDVAAQRFRLPPQQQAQQIVLDRVQVSGKIAEIGPGWVRVTSEDQQTWMIGIDPMRSEIQLTGEAEPGVLSSGVFVRFEAEVDKRGTARGVLKELTVFTPRGEIGEGIAEEGPPPEETPAEERERPRKVPSTQALVAGRVKSFKNGLLLVDTPNKLVRAKVARDATVTLELADYALAQVGDAVEASVWRAQPGGGLAEKISIELAEKVTGPKKRGAGKKGSKADAKDKAREGEEPDEATDAAEEETERPARGKPRGKPRAEVAPDEEAPSDE
jgi:hypothetical protein